MGDQKMVNRNKADHGDNSDTLQSIIQKKTDDNEPDQDHRFLRDDLMKALKSNLSEEEAKIIMMRFGLDTEQSISKRGHRTISEICDLVGYKPNKVRRIINRSLKKLQAVVGKDFELYCRELNL